MIIVKDLESEKSTNIVMIQKFENNISRLTGEITLLESDKETDKLMFDNYPKVFQLGVKTLVLSV